MEPRRARREQGHSARIRQVDDDDCRIPLEHIAYPRSAFVANVVVVTSHKRVKDREGKEGGVHIIRTHCQHKEP